MAGEIAANELPLACTEAEVAMSTDTATPDALLQDSTAAAAAAAADLLPKPSDPVALEPMSPQSTFYNNVSIPVPDVFPQAAVTTSKSDAVSSTHHAVNIPSSGVAIAESSSRVAVQFLVKKSKGFCGAIRFYLNKSVTTSSNFRSLMSSLKDVSLQAIKSTLSNTVPSTETISYLRNSIVSTLKGKRLPNCLRFLKLSLTPYSKKKQIKSRREIPILPMFRKPRDPAESTFLNPVKKPELLTGFQFAKPKIYACSYCDTKFFKLPVYLKHIRRHAEIIRCESCGNAFSSIINKRRHQLQCRKRAI